jgi:hypothetical protein
MKTLFLLWYDVKNAIAFIRQTEDDKVNNSTISLKKWTVNYSNTIIEKC